MLDVVGHNATMFVGDAEVEEDMFGDRKLYLSFGVENKVAKEIGDRRLEKSDMIDGNHIGNLLTELEAERETGDLRAELRVGACVDILDEVVLESGADRILAAIGYFEKGISGANQETELELIAFELIIDIVGRKERGDNTILEKVDLEAAIEAAVVVGTILSAIDNGVVGAERDDAVVARDGAIVVDGDGVDVAVFERSAKAELVPPLALLGVERQEEQQRERENDETVHVRRSVIPH